MTRVPTNVTLDINLHGKHLSLCLQLKLWPPRFWRWVNHTTYRAYRVEEAREWGPLSWRFFDSRTEFPR